MTGRDLKRILTSLISQRSQGPEFIKQWSLAIVLTADEAATVRQALYIGPIPDAAYERNLLDAAHDLLSPALNVDSAPERVS